jgi:hypothetical protein
MALISNSVVGKIRDPPTTSMMEARGAAIELVIALLTKEYGRSDNPLVAIEKGPELVNSAAQVFQHPAQRYRDGKVAVRLRAR